MFPAQWAVWEMTVHESPERTTRAAQEHARDEAARGDAQHERRSTWPTWPAVVLGLGAVATVLWVVALLWAAYRGITGHS